MSPTAPIDVPPTARRILAAAQELLAERGYSELTITYSQNAGPREARAVTTGGTPR